MTADGSLMLLEIKLPSRGPMENSYQDALIAGTDLKFHQITLPLFIKLLLLILMLDGLLKNWLMENMLSKEIPGYILQDVRPV